MAVPCRTRRAGPSDVAEVLAIERDAFSDPWSAAAMRVHLRDVFLVGEIESRIVGFLIGRTVGDQGEILDVAVDRAYRRRGIGRQLVEAALAAMAPDGGRVVSLEVRPSNAAARALYARLGFEVVGRRARYYRDPVEDALVLARGPPA